MGTTNRQPSESAGSEEQFVQLARHLFPLVSEEELRGILVEVAQAAAVRDMVQRVSAGIGMLATAQDPRPLLAIYEPMRLLVQQAGRVIGTYLYGIAKDNRRVPRLLAELDNEKDDSMPQCTTCATCHRSEHCLLWYTREWIRSRAKEDAGAGNVPEAGAGIGRGILEEAYRIVREQGFTTKPDAS